MRVDSPTPSDFEVGCKSTLIYLRKLGVEKVNVPTSLNAHLLNTRVERLMEKIRFLWRNYGFKEKDVGLFNGEILGFGREILAEENDEDGVVQNDIVLAYQCFQKCF